MTATVAVLQHFKQIYINRLCHFEWQVAMQLKLVLKLFFLTFKESKNEHFYLRKKKKICTCTFIYCFKILKVSNCKEIKEFFYIQIDCTHLKAYEMVVYSKNNKSVPAYGMTFLGWRKNVFKHVVIFLSIKNTVNLKIWLLYLEIYQS